MKTFKFKKSILGYLMAIVVMLTFSCKEEAKKEEAKASSNSTSSEVKLDMQMADSKTSIFDWAKKQTPFDGSKFEAAPVTMNTNFGKLEFPGGYPTETTIQKVYDELDLQ